MLRSELNDSLKTAMLSKDKCAVSTLRLILAAIKDRDIAARSHGNADGISDQEINELLGKMTRQRHDSIALYEQGGRLELAEQERREISIIKRYLPAQLGDDETEDAVKGVISEIGAGSIKDMGRLMAELRTRYAGRMDFGKASTVVREHFS